MNWAHAHLIINHFPVMGSIFALGVLAYAMWKNSPELKRFSLGFLVIVALLTIPVYFTGGEAGDFVQNIPGVDPARVSAHDDSALISLLACEALGVIALGGLIIWRREKDVPGWFMSTCLVLSLVIAGLMGWTANLGGEIRLPEARWGYSLPANGTNPATPAGQESPKPKTPVPTPSPSAKP